MRSTPTIALGMLLATIASARAEFVMLTPDEGQPRTEAPAEPPRVQKPPSPNPTPSKSKPVGGKTKTSRPIARGFGQSVPLSFAVRQIVPPSIQVRYGTAEDAEELVDWQGGRDWKRVLQDAVRPLGLEVTLRGSTALISK